MSLVNDRGGVILVALILVLGLFLLLVGIVYKPDDTVNAVQFLFSKIGDFLGGVF